MFLLPSLMRERPASRSSCCSNGQLGVKRDLPSGATVSPSPPSPTDPLLCFLSNSFFYAPLFLFFSSFEVSLSSKKPTWWVPCLNLGCERERQAVGGCRLSLGEPSVLSIEGAWGR